MVFGLCNVILAKEERSNVAEYFVAGFLIEFLVVSVYSLDALRAYVRSKKVNDAPPDLLISC